MLKAIIFRFLKKIAHVCYDLICKQFTWILSYIQASDFKLLNNDWRAKDKEAKGTLRENVETRGKASESTFSLWL